MIASIARLSGVEPLLVLTAVCLGLFLPRFGSRVFDAIERALKRASDYRKTCIVLAGIVVIAVRLALLPWLPVPAPGIHDEYSHLLAGDTLAHGRLANPTHPMWVHFESFHILQTPTYASMQPPGQGLALAAGQKLFGMPWAGVLLSMGLLCSSMAWMLQQWFPPAWALAGTIVFVLRFGVLSYWMNSYWGGAAAAIGGALLLGGLPGTLRKPTVRLSLLMGLGLAIFMNTRPLEGIMAGIPVAACILMAVAKRRISGRDFALRFLAPVAVVLLAAAVWLGVYNRAITGSATALPHVLNRSQYAVAPYFRWQALQPLPEYHHKVFAEFFDGFEGEYFRQESRGLFNLRLFQKYMDAYFFLLGAVFVLALGRARAWIRDRRVWVPAAALTIFLAGLFATSSGFLGHYCAPMLGGLMIVVVTGLEHLRSWRWRGAPVGLLWSRLVPVICLLMLVWSAAVQATGTHSADNYPLYVGFPQNRGRMQIIENLSRDAGPAHLVIVRYSDQHVVHEEWVYNDAQIDGSRVVWAREMDETRNRQLIRYFKDRRIWLLEPDKSPLRLVKYDL